MLGGILTLTVAPTGGFLVSRRLPWRLALVGHSGQEIMVATYAATANVGTETNLTSLLGSTPSWIAAACLWRRCVKSPMMSPTIFVRH